LQDFRKGKHCVRVAQVKAVGGFGLFAAAFIGDYGCVRRNALDYFSAQ